MDETGDILLDPEPEPGPAPATPASRAGSATTRSIATAGLIVTAAFAASRVLGYFRYVVIAAAVPDPAQLDAFFAAFRIPDFLFQLVAAGALSSALIPIVAGLLAANEGARAWRVVSTVTTLMLSALFILAVVVLVAAPVLVPIITPGFDDAEMALTVELTRIMVLAPLFLAGGAVATSVLNARGRFAASAVAPLVYNLAIILGAILLVPPLGVAGLAVGVVIGAMAHLLVQVPNVRRIGARIVPHVDLGEPQARRALLLMVPRALGLGATQVVFLVMTSLASTLGLGRDRRVQLRVRHAPDPDRGHRRAAGRRPAAVPVTRGVAGRHGGIPTAPGPRPAAPGVRDGRHLGARVRPGGRRHPPPVRLQRRHGGRAPGHRAPRCPRS